MTTTVPRQDHDPRLVRRLRRDRGLSQQELADMAGLTKSTVSRAEQVDDQIQLAPKTLRCIAQALGIEIKDLMREVAA